jgi:hypothetical protein
MVGCFGLMDDPGNAYHVSPERLTESHPCISVFALHRAGLLTFGISARLQTAHGGSQLATREAGKIWLDNQPVVIGSHPVLPQRVFICPLCQNIRYKLFQVGGRWACYRCHGLTHASHHRHRTIPNYPRLMRLRRKIGRPWCRLVRSHRGHGTIAAICALREKSGRSKAGSLGTFAATCPMC